MRKKFFIIASIFLLVIIGAYLIKENILLPSPKSKTEKKVAKIRNEEIYQQDIEFWKEAYRERLSNCSEEERKGEILKIIQEQSLILQEAERQKLTTLNPEIFNSPNKNYPQRNILVDHLKGELEKAVTSNISGEAISVWFYNLSAGKPIIPLEEAKKIAWLKINNVYQRVKNGEINMEEAAEIIKKDVSLAKIDHAYQTNAYFKFENKTRENPPFAKDELNKLAFGLKEGEISEIISVVYEVPQDPEKPELPFEKKECHYTFIKIIRKSAGNFTSFSQWLDEKKKEYPIQSY